QRDRLQLDLRLVVPDRADELAERFVERLGTTAGVGQEKAAGLQVEAELFQLLRLEGEAALAVPEQEAVIHHRGTGDLHVLGPRIDIDAGLLWVAQLA